MALKRNDAFQRAAREYQKGAKDVASYYSEQVIFSFFSFSFSFFLLVFLKKIIQKSKIK